MASLPVPPAVAPLTPARVIVCARLHARLSAGCCAMRNRARFPSGGPRGAPRFLPCGRCAVGAAIAARLELGGWHAPPDSLPAEVLDRPQRVARVRWMRSFPAYRVPEDGGGLDPLRGIALATPDDRGHGVDAG